MQENQTLMMLQHHHLGGKGVCLSNKKDHCANYTSSSTKHSSVRLLGGYKAWLRGLAFWLRHWPGRKVMGLLCTVLLCRYMILAKCWLAHLCITFHCTLWTCQNTDLINFNFNNVCKLFFFISAEPRKNSICNNESPKLSDFQWVYQLCLSTRAILF